jgi:formylglycine-generating enzyme required for sulfatase activity
VNCPEIVAIPGAKRLNFSYATKYEVTWREYGAAVRGRNCQPPLALPERLAANRTEKLRASVNDRRFSTNVAVTGVSLADVQCYVSWLNQTTGKTYFLPSVRQWQFLAYGHAKTVYPWGSDLRRNRALIGTAFDVESFQKANYVGAEFAPRIVGQLSPNSFGLADVIGNASELTTDCKFWSGKHPSSDPHYVCATLGGSTLSTVKNQGAPSVPERVIISQLYPDAYVGFRLVR